MGGRGDLVGRVIEATDRYSVKGMVVVLGRGAFKQSPDLVILGGPDGSSDVEIPFAGVRDHKEKDCSFITLCFASSSHETLLSCLVAVCPHYFLPLKLKSTKKNT